MDRQLIRLEVRIRQDCPDCHGVGFFIDDNNPRFEYICNDCSGIGKISKKKIIDLETLKELLDEQ